MFSFEETDQSCIYVGD